MTQRSQVSFVETGVRNLDELLGGGLPLGSVTVIAGPPGSGKTILSQQVGFHNATRDRRTVYFNTLSEPTAKTLRYLRQFTYFDPTKFESSVRFVDLGAIARAQGLSAAKQLILEQVRQLRPSIVVIDSFKVFDDLASGPEELRRFGYEMVVELMAWETTSLLLGEYGARDIETNPLFSIVDGLVALTQHELWAERERTLQIVKMRGAAHDGDSHAFAITPAGLDIHAPGIALRRRPVTEPSPVERRKTHIAGLDDLLGPGIPVGSTLLVSGTAGTGKTALLLEVIYRGALAGEKGIFFSFEETAERLLAFGRGFGWELDRLVEEGLVELVFVPQPETSVERQLIGIRDRVEQMGARRVAVDSVSVFMHKTRDPQIAREHLFQLASIVHNARAVGWVSADVPYGEPRISRFGVEETVVDGIVLLTSVEEELRRLRYVEIFKLRNTAHLGGRHALQIGPDGVVVYPRYAGLQAPTAVEAGRRMPSGVPGLDRLLGGGLLARSATLLSGGTGTGKTTIALQFALAGVARGENALYLTFEEGPAQLRASAAAMGLPLDEAVEAGHVDLVYLAAESIHPPELFSILTERVRARDAQRVVIDAVSDLPPGERMHEGLRPLLTRLIHQFKALGVTSLLTLEAPSFSLQDSMTAGLSPVTDNVIVLRHVDRRQGLEPSLVLLKTRGSACSRNPQIVRLGRGGARIDGQDERGERGTREESKDGKRARKARKGGTR